jgi:hypothetical protein
MFPCGTGKMHASRILPLWHRYFFAGAIQVKNHLYGKGEITCMVAVKGSKKDKEKTEFSLLFQEILLTLFFIS